MLGLTPIAVDANNANRIFEISDGTATAVSVSLSGFTLSNGNESQGGAILSLEPLKMVNMAFLPKRGRLVGGTTCEGSPILFDLP